MAITCELTISFAQYHLVSDVDKFLERILFLNYIVDFYKFMFSNIRLSGKGSMTL